MIKYKLSQIFIYPIKSLGGISLQSSIIKKRGLQYDRRWMLVDENNKYITQRTHPQMALLNVEITNGGLLVSHKDNSNKQLFVPFENKGKEILVTVWNDKCLANESSEEINEWFKQTLDVNCKLVYMPDSSERIVDKKYVRENKLTSFSDGYPFLIIGQSSLDLLNSKLKTDISITRFRPNFVFIGGVPHEEDKWNKFKIGDAIFRVVKPCARCVITTVNPQTGLKGKEPLITLSTYRNVNNKILFGQNLVCEKGSIIKVGDILETLS